MQNSVDAPQYALVRSMVEEKSFYLENNPPYAWPDIVVINGKTISGRSPGESFIAIPFFIISKNLYGFIEEPYNGLREGINFNSGMEVTTSIVVSIFGALSVVMIGYISLFFTKSKNIALFTSILFGLGTLNWKYSSVFYRHSSHIFFLLLACYGLLSLLAKKRTSFLSIFLMIIGSAGALFVEPTSFIFVIVLYLIFILTSLYKNGFSSIVFLLKSLTISFFIIILINLPIFYYNNSLFGSFYKTGWQHQVKNNWLGDLDVTFSTPLAYGVFVNLFFPNKPIPPKFFSQELVGTIIGENQSYEYIIRYDYKGVFFQSPYLFLIIPALFIVLRKFDKSSRRNYIFIMILAFSSCFLQFKYIVFYSPNSYDTRFFLPFVAIISPLISPFLDYVSGQIKRKKWQSIPLLMLVLIVSYLSIFNAWVSNVENYAPHLTGEKRVIASSLISKLPTNFYSNNKKIAIETFPNMPTF